VAKSKAVAKKRANPVVRYFRETLAELHKVNWPTRKQATQLTIIVLIVVGLMSALLGLLDFVFARFVAFIISLA